MVGRVVDAESGLIYLRNRYYDPATGQFLSRDPALALTRSAYGYVDNNPLNGSDPTGHDWGWNPISDVTQAAHDVAHWATTPMSLPNSRIFSGEVNVIYGGLKVGEGAFLVTVGTAEDLSGVGAFLGIPTQAYGVYQLVTGVGRAYRGSAQLIDAFHHPIVCKSPLRYGADFGLDVAPGGGSIEKLLGGLP